MTFREIVKMIEKYASQSYVVTLLMVTEVLIDCLRKRKFNVNRLETIFQKLWSDLHQAGFDKEKLLILRSNGSKVFDWMRVKPFHFHQTVDQIFIHIFMALPIQDCNQTKILYELDEYFKAVVNGDRRSWKMIPNHFYVPQECDDMINCGTVRGIIQSGLVVRIAEE